MNSILIVDGDKRLQRELKNRYTFTDIVGKSKEMGKIFKLIKKVALSNCSVLLRGESGTGKEPLIILTSLFILMS